MQTIQEIREFVVANKAAFVDNLKSIQDLRDYLENEVKTCDPSYVDAVCDNLFLDRYGYIVYLNSTDAYDGLFTIQDIKTVYEAAKIVFAEYPLFHMKYDPEWEFSELGSPWFHSCISPEVWAICYGRRLLEDDEGAINESDDDTAKRVQDFCQEMINTVGIPEEVIWENIEYICYGNEELIAKFKTVI